jgi:hypothetical protein
MDFNLIMMYSQGEDRSPRSAVVWITWKQLHAVIAPFICKEDFVPTARKNLPRISMEWWDVYIMYKWGLSQGEAWALDVIWHHKRFSKRTDWPTYPLDVIQWASLTRWFESEKQQHEARLLSIRTEEKQRMDKMADDLDLKWTEALR